MSIKKLSFYLVITVTLPSCASATKKICGERIQFHEEQGIAFNENEQIFVCGDEKNESWKEIPLSQSEFHLKSFLSHRAYYDPKFEYRDKTLYVDPGPHLIVKSLKFAGEPEGFNDVTFRKIVGSPLTTELLNNVEAWTHQRLRNMGYACAEVKVEAVQETGAITATIKPGTQYLFNKPELIDSIGLYHEAIRRYDAFTKEDQFDQDWLTLSENRAENDGIVVSSQFIYSCPQPGKHLDLRQQVIGGEKRLVTVGVGASTEEIPIAQAQWKNVRLDENGSSLTVQLYGSQRRQQLQSTYNFYAFKNAPRLNWAPSFIAERRNERTFRSYELEANAPLAYKADYAENALIIQAGPSIKRNFSEEQGFTKAITFISLIGDLTFMTHNFELYQTDPHSGSSMDLNVELLFEGATFVNRGLVLRLNGTHLAELNRVFPHQWILGFRYGARTTLSIEAATATSRLPAQYFHTLGGDEDLRGFGRDELAPNGLGGKTAVFGGTELRLAKSLPAGLEPFTFVDLGTISEESLELGSKLYYSPGLGVRWATPFGALRSTFSHGFVSPDPGPNSPTEHFQFFLSFGREF